MPDWTEEYDDDNPAVALYRHVRSGHFRRYMLEVHDHPMPDEYDEESFRRAAQFCEEEVAVDDG